MRYSIPFVGCTVARRRRKRRRRVPFKPLISAFSCGLLAALGIDPRGLLLNAALVNIQIYVQAISWIVLLAIAIYSFYGLSDYLIKGYKAFRMAGIAGLLAIILAILAGFRLTVSPLDSTLLFVASLVLWFAGIRSGR